MKIIELIIVLLGLLFCLFLFYRFPRLKKVVATENSTKSDTVSIIIPARNEEINIANLLNDLKKQSFVPHEIIVIDDDSNDNTYNVAKSFGVRVIKIDNKPHDWMGKSWACQTGAEASSGSLLLFLDADIRLREDALQRLVNTQKEKNATISVQPYHKTKKLYEQFSAIFNIVQTASNGVCLPWKQTLGLFGPVIFINRTDYQKIGGHASVKGSLIEDISLGKQLKKVGLKYYLYVSEGDISYCMYSDGFKSLFQGWTKNIAAGASGMNLLIFCFVFVFITSLFSTPAHVIIYAINLDIIWLSIYSFLYLIWVLVLIILARKIGNFRFYTFVLFPIPLIFFTLVFVISFFIKIFRLKYKWKGRSISGKY